MTSKCLRHLMNRTKSKDHRTKTYEINKIWLSWFDEKMIWLISSWSLELITKENSYLNNFSENLFCQAMQILFQFSLWSKQLFLPSYKSIVLIFNITRTAFFLLFFSFSLYKMVNSEYRTSDYKSSKISIGAIKKIQKC